LPVDEAIRLIAVEKPGARSTIAVSVGWPGIARQSNGSRANG
jgi:hypothetical protein